ncbi:MAG TPA: GAF domain-containing sensor histidine kinase, partial [Chloroflexota bacterium]|nr:GAF domain-containing sensor histidine kinase [Chloroflexota bacterium]
IVRVSASALDHWAMLRIIIDETTAATGTQVCSLYLWDEAEKLLTLTATNGLAQSGVGQVKLGLGEGITGQVAATRQPIAVEDVRKDSRFIWVPNLDQEQFISMLSVPIASREQVVGVMNVQTAYPHVFSSEEVEFLSAIAAQIAGIVELSGLHERLARQLELEREAVQRLQALNASKSDLLSMLSHDFRGPIAIAKSYVHGLRRRLTGEEAGACEEIDAELDMLAKMVDNLMLSLEFEAQGAFALDLQDFDLVAHTAEQIKRLRATSPRHQFELIAPPWCMVRADETKLQAVVVNLLGNAVKYWPDGGTIVVRIEQGRGEVELSVTDQGIGIDGRDSESLFERYGRGDRALRAGISGHGLGLYICRKVIEAHGGRIYARPAERGSRFGFTLPVRDDAA